MWAICNQHGYPEQYFPSENAARRALVNFDVDDYSVHWVSVE